MTKETISPRQLVALAFVGLLSPLVRRFPQTLAAAVGRAGWLAIPLSLPPLLLWLAGWRALLRRQRDWFQLLTDALGRVPGRAAAALFALWMAAYAGFLLRANAVRQLSTVYPEAGPGIFVLSMALVCCLAAAGPLRGIVRAAMVLRPLMLTVIALVLALSAEHVDPGLLLPVAREDLAPAALAGLRLANSFGAMFLLAFLCGQAEGLPSRRQLAGWGGALYAVGAAATVCCIGMFGPELTGRMSYPFFMLARDVTVLGSVERVEPIVVAVSVLSDFVLASILLWMAVRLSLRLLGGTAGDWAFLPALVCGALAAAAALLLPGDLETWNYLSETLVPVLSAVFTAGLPLLTLCVGKLRRRL